MYKIDITPVSSEMKEALQHKIDTKTKPLGALGQLEMLALKLGMIQNSLNPILNNPTVVVFAGDHGSAAAGISPYPQEVTFQMVMNFLAEGAAINVFARQHGLAIKIVDAGVNYDFHEQKSLIHAKIAKGTRNYLDQPAMTRQQCEEALEKGSEIVRTLYQEGCNTIGFGEMGIGNTASASLLMHCFCQLPLEVCVGRGAGMDDAGLAKKRRLLEQALQANSVDETPLSILSTFGGFEIAMMCGAFLQAAALKMVILVDGFITTAALLTASKINTGVLKYCIFSHVSDESGHRQLLNYLQAEPLLNLGMRLGEGTGAALAFPLLQSAVNFLEEMASFESAGVSGKDA
ncbi:MAG: nicotinate-nucleotide--dimethylbenzimidazole phosphoribosyltransferase [SAR324 cluster bacterium]|nr:nicotinate-nucleotide--dimethylbenzimidazole phosphoribosyltransferase [SAR324 cluster bacterium]